MKRNYTLALIIMAFFANSYAQKNSNIAIWVYPDSIVNDVSNHPIGINLDYFMDNDNYLKPQRRTADALKAMGVRYLRYPGGNKSDFYFFSKPPYEKSDPCLARTGKDAVGGRNAALNSDCTDFKNEVLNFDEYIDICREIGAEPVLVVAGDEYSPSYPKGSTWSTREQLINHAVEWVKYANLKKKYNVKYWMIANETWVTQPDASIYANDVLAFSKAMKAIDPTIKIIPNGLLEGWWKTILTTCSDYIDGICISNYPINTTDTIFAFKGSFNPVQIAIKAIDKYGSQSQKNKMKIIVAEYGPFNWGKNGKDSFVNNQRNNLINFEITGYQLLEPRIDFSCFWNTRWIDDKGGRENGYDALDKNGNFNANGYGLMIWENFIGDKMVRTSSTDSIKSFASYTSSENKLFVYLLNKTSKAAEIEIILKDYSIKRINQIWELKGQNLDDQNPSWSKLENTRENGVQILPAATIRVIEYNLSEGK